MKTIITILIALGLTGCATQDFGTAVKANQDNYTKYSDGQLAMQQTIAKCFEFNPNKSECSILAAGTNATQTLAGRPDKIREPSTNGELAAGIVGKVVDGGLTLELAKVAGDALNRSTDANASTANAGIAAAAKPAPDPIIIEPFIVEVPITP